MRHGNVLHLIKIFLLLWNIIFNHSLGVWTSVHYNTHASPATALHWLYLSQRGGRHSQWACVLLSRWVLIYSYSTHTLRWWGYQARIYKTISRLNKPAKNAKNGKNVAERILTRALDLASLPPWVLTTHMQFISMGPHYPHGSTHADPFALSICLYLPFVNYISNYFKQANIHVVFLRTNSTLSCNKW